jgi:hypothetical protein
MSARLSNKRRWLCVVGGVLCLLVASFAFEAKLACYSPDSSPAAQISAAKLQPADAPKLIAQTLSAPSVLHHLPAEPVFAHAVALHTALSLPPFGESVRDGLRLQDSSSLSPHLFRRPPPQS